MDSSVKARPNHYETLGVVPSATAAEIGQAFARKMSAFAARPLAAAAQLGIAFETLRDPERRRAYDASLRPPALPRMGYSARWEAVPLPSSAVAQQQQRPQSARAEAKPFIAAEPRRVDLAPRPRSVVERAPQAQAARRPQPEAKAPPEPARELRLPDVEGRPVEWMRPAIAGGVLVAGVVLLGAFAGWNAGSGEAQEAQTGVTAALPRAKPRAVAAAPSPALQRKEPDLRFRRLPSAAAAARTRPHSPAAQLRPSHEFLAQAAQSLADPAGEATATEAVAEAPAVETAAALPLPNAVVARTLERIGYSCGKVASTSAVGPGAYKVTCTSGASYQAAPVRGRYHFRRLSTR